MGLTTTASILEPRLICPSCRREAVGGVLGGGDRPRCFYCSSASDATLLRSLMPKDVKVSKPEPRTIVGTDPLRGSGMHPADLIRIQGAEQTLSKSVRRNEIHEEPVEVAADSEVQIYVSKRKKQPDPVVVKRPPGSLAPPVVGGIYGEPRRR